jgi:hypothetical protein
MEFECSDTDTETDTDIDTDTDTDTDRYRHTLTFDVYYCFRISHIVLSVEREIDIDIASDRKLI